MSPCIPIYSTRQLLHIPMQNSGMAQSIGRFILYSGFAAPATEVFVTLIKCKTDLP
jgi:hypothetical protein